MKRAEGLRAVAGVLLLGACAALLVGDTGTRRERRLALPRCVAEVTQLGDPQARAAAVIFHGLTANRRTLLALGRSIETLGMKVYLVDHPGHGDSSEPFDHPRAEACAADLLEELTRRGEIRLDTTVLVGHSMGAGIAIRLADAFPTAATISISSAMQMPARTKPATLVPLPFPRRVPVNLLLVVASHDLPRMKDASRRLLEAAGGERYAPADFRQRRAVRAVLQPATTHTSLLFDSSTHAAIGDWIESALPNDVTPYAGRPLRRLAPLAGGLAGLALLFPLAASGLTRALGATAQDPARAPGKTLRLLAAWGVAGLLGVAVQYGIVPLAPVVRMYTGDYLASAAAIAGVSLLITRRRWAPPEAAWRWEAKSVAAAVVLGLGTAMAFGAWLDAQVTDGWPTAVRVWRFALLVPLLLPYCLAEELGLGAARGTCWRAGARRWGVFVALRAVVWAALLVGLVVLRSGEVLVALLVVYLAAFSVAQRLGMDAVRRRTGSAAAAAVFGAILSAWFVCAVFPIT